jgi:hypothetical protein
MIKSRREQQEAEVAEQSGVAPALKIEKIRGAASEESISPDNSSIVGSRQSHFPVKQLPLNAPFSPAVS